MSQPAIIKIAGTITSADGSEVSFDIVHDGSGAFWNHHGSDLSTVTHGDVLDEICGVVLPHMTVSDD